MNNKDFNILRDKIRMIVSTYDLDDKALKKIEEMLKQKKEEENHGLKN